MAETPMVTVTDLSKSYGGVHALRHVELELRRAEIHALCGENGAGKSTLIRCLSGADVPDSGAIRVEGRRLPFGDVRGSEAAGIAVIHQESTVFGDLNAIDNIFVGREPCKRGFWLDRKRMENASVDVLRRLEEDFDIHRPVGDLSVANRQVVAMARALVRRCRVLIMDEPTASLSARETERLLEIVRRLREDGVSVLYVSHRLEEIFAIADRVTVLRDGQRVVTREVADIDKDGLIRLMVGRELDELTRRHGHAGGIGGVRLNVKNLTRRRAFRDISLCVHAGEIVGLAGLVGAGRSEIARAIFGIDTYDTGEVAVDGKPIPAGDVRAAVERGLGLVPEDRQHEGLILPMTVGENVSLAVLGRLTRFGLISRSSERGLVARMLDRLRVKAAGHGMPAETLSGGNQQKLVLGKWLAVEPRVLILDEPTRGVDVGAKAQVHQFIRQLAAGGMATLLISSELSELLSICDRILVMREGRISGEMSGEIATQENIMELALPDGASVPHGLRR